MMIHDECFNVHYCILDSITNILLRKMGENDKIKSEQFGTQNRQMDEAQKRRIYV